jgi:hypothetical protein
MVEGISSQVINEMNERSGGSVCRTVDWPAGTAKDLSSWYPFRKPNGRDDGR